MYKVSEHVLEIVVLEYQLPSDTQMSFIVRLGLSRL